jgi:CRISPR-associated protein Csh1
MIIAMREIARYLDEQIAADDLQKVMTLHQMINKVIILRVKKIKDEWEYQGASIVDFDPAKSTKFLYRQGPSNGPGTTPAALITDIEKTFPKKVLSWFKQVPKQGKGVLSEDEIKYIKAIGESLRASEKEILKESSTLLDTIDRTKGNTLLTIKLEDGTEQFIGESTVFVKIFLHQVKQRYYSKYGTTAKGEGTCYVCGAKTTVFGFVTDVFSFYTLDKQGFAPSLNVSDGWKSFPVCFECAIRLETSKQFLDEHLLFSYYGAKYYLIPHSVTHDRKSLDEVLSVFQNQDKKEISMADKAERLTEDENELLSYTSELSDSVVLNFLFYVMEQSSMRILGYMEDVLPSRISKIFHVKQVLEKRGLYNECEVKFNFSILRDILALGRDAKDYKEFINVTGRVLKDQPVNRAFLLTRILDYLEDRRNEYGLKAIVKSASAKPKQKQMDNVLRSMMLLEFFKISNIEGDEKIMSETQDTTREDIVNDIINAHPSFFDTHSQKVAFVIGLLTGRLLAIQGHLRGASPFEKKLRNLRFTMKRLQRLYVQVQAKLKAYGYSNVYSDVERMLSEEMMSAADEKVDNDEISLSFVIGLNQSYKLKSRKGDEEE